MKTLAWNDAQLIPARSSAALQLRGAKSQRQPGAKEFAVVRSMVAYQLLAKTKVAAGPSDSCLGVDLDGLLAGPPLGPRRATRGLLD